MLVTNITNYTCFLIVYFTEGLRKKLLNSIKLILVIKLL